MIKELTKEQQELLTVYRNKWTTLGLSVEKTNHERARANVVPYYKAGGLEPPEKIAFAKSPLGGMIMANLLKSDDFTDVVDKSKGAELTKNLNPIFGEALATAVSLISEGKSVNDEIVKTAEKVIISYCYDWCGGNLWSGWQAFYDYFLNVVNIEGCKIITPTLELSKDVGWIFPYENVCILTEKPMEIKLNTRGQLHNEHGTCIKYSDGWGFYSLNGVNMPSWVLTTPKEKLSSTKILGITNTEQRAQAMRYFGMENFLEHLNSTLIDELDDYKLYTLKVEGVTIGPYLYMVCPSSGRKFLEGVGNPEKYDSLDTSIKTCEDALKWRAKKASKNFMTKFNLKGAKYSA